ncbi:hypothetical protein SAMN04489760_101211 [Syntrophus gentianae]|uniref:Uncharacterized protein n=1 Tax=Syntrophus gentianae TaxID=43775 RepID=A0A1H7UIA9_9BACT|nr:hypothetical protein SAMN04489760_101211 [Syntrophus gentianae]
MKLPAHEGKFSGVTTLMVPSCWLLIIPVLDLSLISKFLLLRIIIKDSLLEHLVLFYIKTSLLTAVTCLSLIDPF